MTKRILAILVLVCLAAMTGAAPGRAEKSILSKYDVDGAAYTYCALGDEVTGPGRIETSGSSATVTAVAGYSGAAASPFASVAVGDEIFATSAQLSAPVRFTVIGWASATEITADQAINLDVASGTVFTYRTLRCGTAATDGWFLLGSGEHHLEITYRRGDLTGGLDWSLESGGRGGYAVPARLASGTITSTTSPTNNVVLAIVEKATLFRVGLQFHTADPSDAAANLDQVDVLVWSEGN